MAESDSDERMRFWPVVGIATGASVLLALGYALIQPGFSFSLLSDGLCISALVLSLGAAVPLFLDAGRGFSLGGKISSDKTQQRDVWKEERRKREQGMRITFALALAAFLIGLASLLISLV
jgi:hypothetical protein